MSTPLLLHIGYHKTATTWMQRQLFLPVHGYRQLCGHNEVSEFVVKPHTLRFDAAPMRALISRELQFLQPGETPVISSEILSGHPFHGGRESCLYAERLARITTNARVLISVRNQMRILPSLYMQYIQRGGTLPAPRFFDGTREFGYFAFSAEHFEYSYLVEHYQQLFGPQNVYILPQESLQRNIEVSMVGLAKFSGNELFRGLCPTALKSVGESYPEYAAPVLRRINHIQGSTLNPWPIVSFGHTPKGLYRAAGFLLKRPMINSMLKDRKPISDHVNRRFAGYYALSNCRLPELAAHSLDLSGYDGIKKSL